MKSFFDVSMALMIALFLSSFFTWMLLKSSRRRSILDKARSKDGRPQLGGLALYLSFWLTYLWVFPKISYADNPFDFWLASTIVVITGVVDDFWVLKPWVKSLGILLAAFLVYRLASISFNSRLLAGFSPEIVQVLTGLSTIFWIYLVTNAINLLDGIDGLASSVTLTSLLAMSLVTLKFSLTLRMDFLMMLLILAVSIFGFLVFNWPPAKILLGDTGALFIGFMYASLTVTNLKKASLYSIFIPIILCVVPLFDTGYAFLRRFVQGKPVTQGDLDHVHHRLIRQGLSPWQINWRMISVTVVFSILAYFFQYLPGYRLEIIIVSGLLLVWMGLAMFQMRGSSRNKNE